MQRKIKISRHGEKDFDEKYFAPYYKKYTEKELLKAYGWFKGWIRLIEQYIPLNDTKGKKVLEVGCGIGAFTRILKEKGYQVEASDVSAFIIDKAQKLQKDIHFTVEDAEKETGKKEEFDLIFALEVFEHLNNPQKALKNLKNRLKKGGFLILSSPYPTKRTLADPTHINVHTPQEWISLCRSSGFKLIKFTYVTFIPFFYRYHSLLSWAFPLKSDLPIIVNTCFFIFKK